jgi:hypothetical protein
VNARTLPPTALGSDRKISAGSFGHENGGAGHRLHRLTMSRFSHPIRIHRASRAGLVAGTLVVLASAAAGCGSAHHLPAKAADARRGQATADARPQQGASRSGGSTVVVRPIATADARTPFIAAGPVIKTFTGDGGRAIGSLAEKRTIVLQWKTSAPTIQLFTAQGQVLVDTHSPVGSVRLSQGRYPGLHVATPGRWTVQLRLVP